jgi:DNA (cytosine-5)-methyltransferase 1
MSAQVLTESPSLGGYTRPLKKAADLMCGAGGTSLAIRNALAELGFDVDLVVVNHWETAIATHAIHFPKARHYCQDIATLRPEEAVPGGHLHLLCASPTCTHHSRARGGKPTSDQQRADPWHVVTWLTRLKVDRLFIENVPEFRDWGPVDPETGKPIKARKGEYFRQWIATIRGLGFDVDWRIVNAANHGDATTRSRFYLQGRSDGLPITWPAPTHAKVAGVVPRWRPMRECIDWSIEGRSIFARKRPLAPNTLRRIHAGIMKFEWPEPFLIVLRQHMAARGLDLPAPTIMTTSGYHLALVQPVGDAPFILSQASGGAPRGLDHPLQTLPAGGAHALIAPYYSSGSGQSCTSDDQPLPTASTRDRFGLVVPITHAPRGADCRARSINEPGPTFTCANRGELAFIVPAFGERKGQAPRSHSVDAPGPTICAEGRIPLVEGVGYDILYRMLQPHELAAAMSLIDGGKPLRFQGTKTAVNKQIGNAVPERTARALIRELMSR